MPLTLKELKRLHDKAFVSGQVTRERASDDLVFYWITHWDDQTWDDSELEYRGEFDMIRSAGRDILSQLASNPVQNDFEAINDTPDEIADVADGLYRRDCNHNDSIEAFAVGEQESVVCGYGAWILETKYKSNRTGDKKQIITRKAAYEANNNGFWDPNAKKIDKSDANHFSYLSAYSADGYKKYVSELTGEAEEDINPSSFGHPEESYVFPWITGEGEKIYVVAFYHREKIKETIVTMIDPFGETSMYRESVLDPVLDELLEAGFTRDESQDKVIDTWEIRKYIASGQEILNGETNSQTGEREGERIAGTNIPVVPIYGEYALVEGEIHYEGVTRLAKDPQRNRDFALSYLTDLFSKSPREKPIFFPEQIAGHLPMYELNGADNNYPFLYQNRKALDGEDLPIGPVGLMPAPNVPPALAATIDLSSQAIREVANPGIPQDITDVDIAKESVLAFQSRLDMQSMIYQTNRKHSKRRDAEIYAGMASEIYDTTRTEKIELPDGTKKEVDIMKYVMDEETGDLVILNDFRTAEFEITSRIGADYTSQKEQTLDRLENTLATMQPDDPLRKVYQLKISQLSDGTDMKDINEYARKQLILEGIIKPETDEEKEMLEQAQNAPQEPDAAMTLALAEDKKGEADILNAQREGIKMQLDDENTKVSNKIDMFHRETERMALQVKAQESGAKIGETSAKTIGQQIDNQSKLVDLNTPDVKDMSDEDLIKELMAG